MWIDPITDIAHLLLLLFHVVLSPDHLYPSLKQSQCCLSVFQPPPHPETYRVYTRMPNIPLVPGCQSGTQHPFLQYFLGYLSAILYSFNLHVLATFVQLPRLMHHPSLPLTCQKFSSALGIQICPVQHFFVVVCCNPYVTIYRVIVQSNLDLWCHV